MNDCVAARNTSTNADRFDIARSGQRRNRGPRCAAFRYDATRRASVLRVGEDGSGLADRAEVLCRTRAQGREIEACRAASAIRLVSFPQNRFNRGRASVRRVRCRLPLPLAPHQSSPDIGRFDDPSLHQFLAPQQPSSLQLM